MGHSTRATAAHAFAFGQQTVASGRNSLAMGENVEARGHNSVAIGDNISVTGKNSMVIGLGISPDSAITYTQVSAFALYIGRYLKQPVWETKIPVVDTIPYTPDTPTKCPVTTILGGLCLNSCDRLAASSDLCVGNGSVNAFGRLSTNNGLYFRYKCENGGCDVLPCPDSRTYMHMKPLLLPESPFQVIGIGNTARSGELCVDYNPFVVFHGGEHNMYVRVTGRYPSYTYTDYALIVGQNKSDKKSALFRFGVDFEGKANFAKDVTFNEVVRFDKGSVFKENVIFEKDVDVLGRGLFKDKVTFEKDVDVLGSGLFKNRVKFDEIATFEARAVFNGGAGFSDPSVFHAHTDFFGTALFANLVQLDNVVTPLSLKRTPSAIGDNCLITRIEGATPELRMKSKAITVQNESDEPFIVYGNGNLTTKGRICATEVIINEVASGCTPDYVFAPEYKLASLKNVEQFIQTHRHLPDVPSAKEVESNGLNLAEMNLILLKKIEELTLHAIEQQKRIERLENQVCK
jgi:hypothetical protein